MLTEDVRIGEDVADQLDTVQDLDQPGLVVVERAGRVASQPLAVLLQLGVGLGRPELVDDVDSGQRAPRYIPSG